MAEHRPDVKEARLAVGIVIRKQPGVTRWARWIWKPVAVLPGAGLHAIAKELKRIHFSVFTVRDELHGCCFMEGFLERVKIIVGSSFEVVIDRFSNGIVFFSGRLCKGG